MFEELLSIWSIVWTEIWYKNILLFSEMLMMLTAALQLMTKESITGENVLSPALQWTQTLRQEQLTSAQTGVCTGTV